MSEINRNKNDIRLHWDRMAHRYRDFVSGEFSYSRLIEQPAAAELLGSLTGLRVLDAGCGSGHSTFFLEGLNPRLLVGIDLSPEMIALAEEEKVRRGSAATFYVGDGETLDLIPDESLDLVFSSTMTHYFPSLEPFFTACSRVLKLYGRLVISVIHPLYSAQYPIDSSPDRQPDDDEWTVRYLDRRPREYLQPWIESSDGEKEKTTSFHHTFSDYFQALTSAGFQLIELVEPEPPQVFKERFPERYEAYVTTPTFALLGMVKVIG